MTTDVTRVEIPTAFDICAPLTQVATKTYDSNGKLIRNTRRYELGWIDDPNYTPRKASDPPTKPLSVGSVTSIIDNQLRNFGLEWWRERWIRDGMEDNDGRMLTAELSQSILSASSQEADSSAALGVELHSALQEMLLIDPKYNMLDSLQNHLGYWSEQLDPALRGALHWRKTHSNLRLIGTELGVWCHQDRLAELGIEEINNHGISYGGQVDALFQTDDILVAVDWKSSSGIYQSAAMQLAAYCYALEDMLEHRQSTLGNLNGHSSIPSRVMGLIVRFDNGYPKKANGSKDRSQPKVFSGKVEEARVTVADWFPSFMNCYYLAQSRKRKVAVTSLPVPTPGGNTL